MNSPPESLVKYGNPVLAGPQQSAPPPPRPRSASADLSRQQNQEILHAILPPREWVEANQLWVQQVSRTPSTQADAVYLKEQLDLKLQQRQARETGICPIHMELYSQCFDELIRQVTLICAERGLLLSRVRDEIKMTMYVYQALYESSMAFSGRNALNADKNKADMEKIISALEDENRLLNEQIAEYEAMKWSEIERGRVEEQEHTQEMQFLKKRTNRLKVCLEELTSPNN
ncbi:axonemal dynein light intermediate polypeptide 1-like [Myripristis murdjan]|uniref:axonemal dynein light intermediate polypeptide 1-like n=1 Tax=Myripristis murdjan TaxID=586833 RepID=UPI001176348A|nr:axonemal dynein light intermediate polypeptide 1-like [Myripristis murdjan]